MRRLTTPSRRSRFCVLWLLSAAIGTVSAAIPRPVDAAEGNLHEAIGSWQRSDGDVRAKLATCGAGMCMTNTWVRNPGEEKSGDYLVLRVKTQGGGSYSGSAYDPQRKRNYNVQMDVSPERMTTTGCVLGGILCKSVSWTRIH